MAVDLNCRVNPHYASRSRRLFRWFFIYSEDSWKDSIPALSISNLAKAMVWCEPVYQPMHHFSAEAKNYAVSSRKCVGRPLRQQWILVIAFTSLPPTNRTVSVTAAPAGVACLITNIRKRISRHPTQLAVLALMAILSSYHNLISAIGYKNRLSKDWALSWCPACRENTGRGGEP